MTGAQILRGMVIGGDMTEDELLAGITEALTFGGWRWTHIRRSDGITVGMAGLPDIIAVHPERGLALTWELKSTNGRPTLEQYAWLHGFDRVEGIDARVIYPIDYDAALEVILRGADPVAVFGG